MNILGISAFYHDSAAAIISNGEIIAAAQEERFTRRKHDPSFPINAVKFCLNYSGLSLNELQAIAFYDKPLLKFERLLETYYAFAPEGLKSFISAIPVWIKEKLMLKDIIMKELSGIDVYDAKKLKLLFPEHHLSHASSAFYPSPFKESAVLTIDGVGEWATAAVCYGKGRNIKILKELRFPHSVGLLYSAFTYYLGFKVNSGEYKLMGLSPYGIPDSENVRRFIDIICSRLVHIREDGSIWLNQDYFQYATGLRMTYDEKWEELFGFPRREPETEIGQHHCDLALAIQRVTEDIVLKMAQTAKHLTGSDYLCLAGGVALNCVANAKLLGKGLFNDIWIQPAAGDAGGALGAALAAYHIHFGKEKISAHTADMMKGSYLGPVYSDIDIGLTARKYKASYRYYEDFDDLCNVVADLISRGNVTGWFQGRMEWGPRALGNRSILGDARNSDIQKRMNLKIKFRESFRPFAPSVLSEDTKEYFNIDRHSPYMLLIADVSEKRRNPVPGDYYTRSVREKLYFKRSDLPAITHIDFSARLQTVHRETNPRFWKLLKAFREKTSYSVIVNTSFNVRGEPIVCTPEHAYRCFMRTDMDYLVLGNYLFDKKEQPPWKENRKVEDEFGLD